VAGDQVFDPSQQPPSPGAPLGDADSRADCANAASRGGDRTHYVGMKKVVLDNIRFRGGEMRLQFSNGSEQLKPGAEIKEVDRYLRRFQLADQRITGRCGPRLKAVNVCPEVVKAQTERHVGQAPLSTADFQPRRYQGNSNAGPSAGRCGAFGHYFSANKTT